MSQLLTLLNQVFDNQSKINELEQSMSSTVLKAVKTIKNAFLGVYDAWVEARLEQAKHYNKHSHIE